MLCNRTGKSPTNFVAQHAAGKDNLAADALFRISEINILAAVDFSANAVAQKDVVVVQELQIQAVVRKYFARCMILRTLTFEQRTG